MLSAKYSTKVDQANSSKKSAKKNQQQKPNKKPSKLIKINQNKSTKLFKKHPKSSKNTEISRNTSNK